MKTKFFLILGLLGSFGCGNTEDSELDRIPDYDYLQCPQIDLNHTPVIESQISGVYEGLALVPGGYAGVEFTVIEHLDPGRYSYMLLMFPIVSNPNTLNFVSQGWPTRPKNTMFLEMTTLQKLSLRIHLQHMSPICASIVRTT